MPIKYPRKYSPRYYNPNWSQYSVDKISWDYHNKTSTTTKKTTTKITSHSKKEKNKVVTK